jgi:acetoin utilization protein AcuC
MESAFAKESGMAAAFVYDDRLLGYDFGPTHPLRPRRLRLTYELLRDYGAVREVVTPRVAREEEILAVHAADYVEAVARIGRGERLADAEAYGFSMGDNPPFPGVYDAALLYCGAALTAAEIVLSGQARVAFSPSGGLHHAMPNRASGFCVFNDCAVVLHHLRRQVARAIYIDIDAHHGDGVQVMFYDDPTVMTVSIHETGETLYPQTGFPEELGEGPGAGYSVNIPVFPGTDDATFLRAFTAIVPPLVAAFRPDILVAQLGCDTHHEDPLSHLCLTTRGFRELVRIIDGLCDRWVALGGGGYNVQTVPRAWTLAYEVMAGLECPDEVPEPFKSRYGSYRLHDRNPVRAPVEMADRVLSYAVTSIAAVQRLVFPYHGL